MVTLKSILLQTCKSNLFTSLEASLSTVHASYWNTKFKTFQGQGLQDFRIFCFCGEIRFDASVGQVKALFLNIKFCSKLT